MIEKMEFEKVPKKEYQMVNMIDGNTDVTKMDQKIVKMKDEGTLEGCNDGSFDGKLKGSLLAMKMEKMKWEPMVKMTGLMKVTLCGIDRETVRVTDWWRDRHHWWYQ